MSEAKAFYLGYVARVRKVAETTVDGKRILIQELLPWFGDFKGEPILQAKEAGTNRLVGYIGFHTFHHLTDTKPECIALGQIKVWPEYRRTGFSNQFLALALHLASQAKVPIILEQKPTSDKPLEKEGLRIWYKMHGFREFSKEERDQLAHEIHMHGINRDLLFAGFQHSTGKITGKKVYSISREEIEAMNNVPEEHRIQLYRQHLIAKYGTDRAFETNLQMHRRIVEAHLFREPAAVHEPLLTKFKINSKYRFPTKERLNRTWESIRKAGKQPRKIPEAPRPMHGI